MHLWDTRAAWPSAQTEVSGQPLILDEEQAIRLALSHSPELLSERNRVQVASARVAEERQLENPQLRLKNAEIDRMVDHELSLDVGLRVPLPKPWTRDVQIQRAELEHQGTKASYIELERLTKGRIRKLFAKLAMLEAASRELDQAIARSAPVAELAEGSRQSGAISDLDAALILTRRAELIDRRHELRLDMVDANARLRRSIGLRPDQTVTFRTAQHSLAETKSAGRRGLPLELDEQSMLRRALAERKDLREAAAQVAMADADLYRSRSDRWPWLRFFDVYYRFRSALRPSNFEFGLGVDLPLLSWNRGEIAKRDAQLALRRNQEQALLLTVAHEVQAAIARVRESQARVQELERDLLPSLESGARAVREAAAQSMLAARRRVNLEWRVFIARQRYREAILAHTEALIDLEVALGG